MTSKRPRIAACVAATIAWCTVVAPASLAATGPVDVPTGKKVLRASESRQIQYTLGSGFTRYRTVNGSRTTSQYARRTKIADGQVCTVVISGVGRVVRTAPDAGGEVRVAGGPFDVARTGTAHGLHWATGTGSGHAIIATAWRRTESSDGLGDAKGWLAFDLVASDVNNTGSLCRPYVLRERDRIARAALSFRVVARP